MSVFGLVIVPPFAKARRSSCSINVTKLPDVNLMVFMVPGAWEQQQVQRLIDDVSADKEILTYQFRCIPKRNYWDAVLKKVLYLLQARYNIGEEDSLIVMSSDVSSELYDWDALYSRFQERKQVAWARAVIAEGGQEDNFPDYILCRLEPVLRAVMWTYDLPIEQSLNNNQCEVIFLDNSRG